MTISVDAFIAKYKGRAVDVDGAYGAQCWDLWSAYAQQCFGVPQNQTNTTSGYADSVFTVKYGQSKALQNVFTKAWGTGYKGDVAFWAKGSTHYPYSHVAIVIRDLGNGYLECLSQNPGAPKVINLTKQGLCGYLRPKSLHKTTTTTKHKSGSANVLAGTYQVIVDKLNVRDKASTKGKIVAAYKKGDKLNLVHWGVYADGYAWGKYTSYSGKTRYISVGTDTGSQWYLKKC